MRVTCAVLASMLAVTISGCGTMMNLKDPPNGPLLMGTGTCYPFGGAVRSGVLAVAGPPSGIAGVIAGSASVCEGEFDTGFKTIGSGIWITALGLGAIADTPISLAGDILTWPIAYARSNECWWATWWGRESHRDEKSHDTSKEQSVPTSDGDNMANDCRETPN